MKRTRYALFQSVIALILCVSMLAGTTFAWFTDSVSSTNNRIAAGTLDVELEYLDGNTWKKVDETTEVMDKDALWEPGYTEVVYLRVSNQGKLALKYALGVGVLKELGSINAAGQHFYLSDYIRFGLIESATEPNYATREDAMKALSGSKIISEGVTSTGTQLNENGDARYVTLVVYMPEDVGNAANYATGVNPPEIELGLELVATQAEYEADSFGSSYDSGAGLAGFNFPATRIACSTSAGVEKDENDQTANAVTLTAEQASAEVPEGVKLEGGANILTLEVASMDKSEANVTLESNEAIRSLDVHVKGIAKDNTVPMAITIKEAAPKGLNMGNYQFYHVENGETIAMEYVSSDVAFTKHNQFKYDPATGDIILYMATFSEIAMVADTENAWNGTIATAFANGEGTEENPYIIANADQLAYLNEVISNDNGNYGDKNYKLISDINLGGEASANNGVLFYPIGYHKVGSAIATVEMVDAPEAEYIIEEDTKAIGSAVSADANTWYTFGGAFQGTFDGAGHTVANIYQNTWQLKGNYEGNYWNAAMGLFGYVYGGTVKNLTVSNFSSDGEFTPTGVIAAYAANSTFENIAIVGCNPRVYNTGNGGIVGIGGNSDDPDSYKLTFTNITIDNTNKISALWGSWDVACGGLVGMFRGAGHVYMTNCHVAAQIDVFNDVCGNYQYYWYRYAGMMVGTNKNMITDANGYTVPETSKFHAENCTVHFGEWNDYYYCELVSNSLASYTHDHQFSRLEQISSLDEIKSGDTWTKAGNFLLISGDTKTCYHIVNKDGTLTQHRHTDAGEETVNGKTVLKEDNQIVYLPFNQLFTGYGWGVKHIPIDDNTGFTGITILKREVADSVVKFTGKVSTLSNNKEYTIGEIFAENTANTATVPVKDAAIVIGITNLNENNPVTAVFEAGESWEDGTITFTGSGKIKITIQDYYYCSPTTIEVDIEARTEATKFESKFTGDFLYRVGNENAVELGSLFTDAKFDEQGNTLVDENGNIVRWDINNSDLAVTVETVNGNAAGTFASNTADWTKGTIQFSGTGVVKVTITDNDYCIPTELYLEIIDATNVPENGKIGNYNTTSVLLGNTTVSTLYLSGGATLYGNGFTIDCTKAPINGSGSVSENYIIELVDAHLDNVVVKGAVYTQYGAMASNDYNRALVVSKGNSTITNCYLSNTASPIRLVEGNLYVKGTTVKGGNFANIDVRNGHLTVEDVTTINEAKRNDKAENGATVIGLGIVVYYENVDTSLTSVTIKGNLQQHNLISSNDAFSHEYATQLVGQMMSDTYADLQTVDSNNVKWVNPGYVAMTKVVPEDKRENKDGYIGKDVSFAARDGYVYAVKPTAVNDDGVVEEEITTPGQGAIPPAYSFDYTTKNYIAKTDGSNDYCYYENGKVLIAMDQGDTFEWDPFILTATKNGQTLDYSVTMNDKTYVAGEKIKFNTSGEYVVTYTYKDENNYKLRNIVSESVTYTKNVNINVSVIHPKAKHAEFTFGSSNTATEKLTVNDKTYISAKGVSATDKQWGYITVNGQKIFYPIIEAQFKKATLSSEYTVYYYVFNGTVTIKDYKDNGTGGEQVYNASTTTMPSSLKVINGMEAKYASISSACVDISKLTKDGPSGEVWDFSASTTVSGTTKYNGFLAHQSPSGLAIKSGTRDYEAITVAQFSYTDAAGATYYYFVGYYMPKQETSSSGGGCVTPDTLVTLADGTQKRIDQVTYNDRLLVWDFYKGTYAEVPSAIIFDHGYDYNTVIDLKFSDGTNVKAVNLHQFFDADLNKFVTIDDQSVSQYVGHRFVKQAGRGYKLVTLTDYSVCKEYVEAYGIISAEHYNVLVEGMFSTDFMPEDYNLFNYFKVAKGMTFNTKAMEEDIATYGLYTYADFADYLTQEQFAAFNVQYFKIPVGKGEYTYDGIIALIREYLNN